MTVLAPGDGKEVAELVPQALRLSGPSYLRIGRYGEPEVRSKEPVVLGSARLLREGERVGVIAVGDLGSVAGDALDRLASEGIRPAAYQMHTVKPLDVGTLEALARRVHTILVVEEHFPAGGASPAIAQWLASAPGRPRLVRCGAPDALALGSPSRAELRRRMGIDADGIASAVRTAWTN
jgi:transketolase